jgi:serine protease Do
MKKQCSTLPRNILSWLLFLMMAQLGFAQDNQVDFQAGILAARNKVLPALVHVEPVRTFFSTGERRHTLVTGSGFIISQDGYILTNHHVVENAEKVSCTLSNKKKLSAKVVGSDPSTDVAVLQLNLKDWDGKPLPFAQLGDSDSLEVGQFVLALGSPLGLSRSVSMGVISSIDRYFEDRGSMISPFNLWIQTDAAINPGNSGGPLINLDGKVVGINARGVFMAENLGFAIPINLAKEVSEKLIRGNTIRRSWFGLELQPVKDLREYLKMPELKGALIAHLDPFSPGIKAGLQPGDVLTSINGVSINANYEEDLPAIRKIIADMPADQKVTLGFWRDGKLKKSEVTTQLEPFEYQPEFECEDWGLVVKNINRNIFKIQALPDYDGAFISAVKNGELAEKSGLRAGDLIRSINKIKIKNLAELIKFYDSREKIEKNIIFFEVLRQGAIHFAAINLIDAKE